MCAWARMLVRARTRGREKCMSMDPLTHLSLVRDIFTHTCKCHMHTNKQTNERTDSQTDRLSCIQARYIHSCVPCIHPYIWIMYTYMYAIAHTRSRTQTLIFICCPLDRFPRVRKRTTTLERKTETRRSPKMKMWVYSESKRAHKGCVHTCAQERELCG